MVEELTALTGEELKTLPGYGLDYDLNNIGDKTHALLAIIIATGMNRTFHNNLVNERIAFMRRIAENSPEDREYLGGWIDRAELFRQ